MEVIKVTPRGYCYGVVDAIQMVREAAKNPDLPRPIYIIGLIVHNRHIVEELQSLGVISLDGLDRKSILENVNEGTVIFTAHGVSPAVIQRAHEKGLHVLDATCPDVTKTHNLVKDLVAQGYDIIYIGKKGHPEPEGVIGEAPGHVYLVETSDDVAELNLSNPRLAVSTQTTLSQWDTARLIEEIQQKYPHVEVYNEICLATQLRQEAIARMAVGADGVIVVGDPRSNNTNRLVQVAIERAGVQNTIRIENLADLDPAWLEGKQRIAITAGASTPSELTREVIRFVESYGKQVVGRSRAAVQKQS